MAEPLNAAEITQLHSVVDNWGDGDPTESCASVDEVRSLFATITARDDYLREKNEIIKAYAGTDGMTPEDVAYALETLSHFKRRAVQLEVALRKIVSAACQAPMSDGEAEGQYGGYVPEFIADECLMVLNSGHVPSGGA